MGLHGWLAQSTPWMSPLSPLLSGASLSDMMGGTRRFHPICCFSFWRFYHEKACILKLRFFYGVDVLARACQWQTGSVGSLIVSGFCGAAAGSEVPWRSRAGRPAGFSYVTACMVLYDDNFPRLCYVESQLLFLWYRRQLEAIIAIYMVSHSVVCQAAKSSIAIRIHSNGVETRDAV